MSDKKECKYCGCDKLEENIDGGGVVCTNCGAVLSENTIVNEVQFVENSSGGSSAVGQFVSSDGLSRLKNIVGLRGPCFRESREVTLSNAKKRISAVCQNLRLTSSSLDTAYSIFKLALTKGLTKGRKKDHTIGACVYITCRTDQTPHMLIDVSDALQIDIYELGRNYLKLCTELHINVPAMDPCLYICRFAHKLSLDDKTHAVTETALRIVQRMKSDWMHTGRRPSGLCGAALIIAARLHEFDRTISDVIKIVRVHESTLRKRLKEFGETPSSALTLDEFMTVNLDEEQDPPSFRAARQKEKEDVEKLVDQQLNLEELTQIQKEIEKQLEEKKKKMRGIWAKFDKEEAIDSMDCQETADTQKFITNETLETINELLTQESIEVQPEKSDGIAPSSESLGLRATLEECMEIHPEEPVPEDNGILDLNGIDDGEIDSYILSDREVRLKTDLWMNMNKEYLEEQEMKEEKEKKEAEQREKDGKPPKRKKSYKVKSKTVTPANSAGEAIEKMLIDKKLSNKINYDILRSLTEESEEDTAVNTNTTPFFNLGSNKESKQTENTQGLQSVLKSIVSNSSSKKESNNNPKQSKQTSKVSFQPVEEDNTEVLENKTNNYADEEMEDDYDDDDQQEEDDGMMSTAQLLKRRRGNSDDYDDYDDDY